MCTSRYQQIVFNHTNEVSVSLYAYVRLEVHERIFHAFSPRCNVFFSLVMQTEREPHIDHYRWTFALAMLFTLFMTWFPYIDFRNSEWFSACNLRKCVRAYHDMSIFT